MKIFEELLTRISLRQPVVLCTVIETDRSVPRKAGAKMLVHEDGSTYGTIGGGEMESRVIHAAKESIKAKKTPTTHLRISRSFTRRPRRLRWECHNLSGAIYATNNNIYSRAGHIGKAVSELSSWLGYKVIVWDDREDIISTFTGEGETLTGDLSTAIQMEPIDEHTQSCHSY